MAETEQAKGCILLVEDNADLRQTMADLLEEEGYQVVCAENGQEALSVLQRKPQPDLILLDLAMPVMNGWVFRSQQQREAALAAIPTVVLSGEADLASEAASLHATDYLPKPVNITALFAILNRYCG